MAVQDESSALMVTVTYGNEKHNLYVDSQEEDSQPTVHDLALLTEQVTGVPVSFQKLIYKGKSLKEMEQPLSTLGVKNGCKVMLIGKRNSPEEETELKKLKVLEKSVEQLAKKIDQVNKELRDIQNGFLEKNIQTEALSLLDKRIKGTAEQFMKILEQIDAINRLLTTMMVLRVITCVPMQNLLLNLPKLSLGGKIILLSADMLYYAFHLSPQLPEIATASQMATRSISITDSSREF